MEKTILLLMLFLPLHFMLVHASSQIHVSLLGNDTTGDGTADKPYLTFNKAKEVANIKKESGAVDILIHPGTYTNNISLTRDDRGYANAPISYKSYGGKVTLSGSVAIGSNEFSIAQDNRIDAKADGRVMVADISAIIPNPVAYPIPSDSYTIVNSYYEVYESDTLQTYARFPNNGYALTGDIIDDGLVSGKPMFTALHTPPWLEADGVVLAGYWGNDWSFQPITVDSVDGNNVRLTNKPEYTIIEGSRYYAMGALELVDLPGEWYIDSEQKKLYYYPAKPNFTLEIATSITPAVRMIATS